LAPDVRLDEPAAAAEPSLHLAAGVRLIRFIRQLVAQPAPGEFIGSEMTPGPAVVSDEQAAACFVRQARTGNHAVGTCRMGLAHESVLDPQLRVRGVPGLRVVDASAISVLVSGNTNGPVMVMAWRAAELIPNREDHVS